MIILFSKYILLVANCILDLANTTASFLKQFSDEKKILLMAYFGETFSVFFCLSLSLN